MECTFFILPVTFDRTSGKLNFFYASIAMNCFREQSFRKEASQIQELFLAHLENLRDVLTSSN